MFAPVQDPLTSLEDIIRGLMTSKLDLFVGMGQNLFRGFATILIAWFGVQSALSSAEGGEGFNFARFSRLLLVIAFGFAMVKYYSTPIPGFGMSFPDLVMQEASSLSNSIGMDQARLIETKVTEVEQGMEQPSAVNFHETLTFVVLYVILATVQAVVPDECRIPSNLRRSPWNWSGRRAYVRFGFVFYPAHVGNGFLTSICGGV